MEIIKEKLIHESIHRDDDFEWLRAKDVIEWLTKEAKKYREIAIDFEERLKANAIKEEEIADAVTECALCNGFASKLDEQKRKLKSKN